ncbi:MAG: diaminopimelate decarboxylase [Candidatus Pacearchaeota archaeon]
MTKTFPLTKGEVLEIIKRYNTPFYMYDERAIRENARLFNEAFSILPGFKNYFAVKALPNPFIMKILKECGMGADCSSLAELVLAERVGIMGDEIMFTSNDTPENEFIKAKELEAIINLDDITHIDFLERCAGLPDIICFRYNPGPLKKGNFILGNPIEAKYGLTREQMIEAYRIAKAKGVKRFGIHSMVASNELNPYYFIETARILFELVYEVYKKTGVKIEFVNLGGGIGIPYKPNEKPVDYNIISQGVKEEYEKILLQNDFNLKNIFMECGRVITGPYGYLVTRVLHLKNTYKKYVGCDACMANLMRPGMYGAYHEISVLGKENEEPTTKYDVTGSLCENNDKFAIDRMLPKIEIGDILIIHDAGAHGHSMGFNYNGKLRSAELLLRMDGSILEIRRAETIEDYLKTIDFNKLEGFT